MGPIETAVSKDQWCRQLFSNHDNRLFVQLLDKLLSDDKGNPSLPDKHDHEYLRRAAVFVSAILTNGNIVTSSLSVTADALVSSYYGWSDLTHDTKCLAPDIQRRTRVIILMLRLTAADIEKDALPMVHITNIQKMFWQHVIMSKIQKQIQDAANAIGKAIDE